MSNSATWYFITICVYGRQLLLGEVTDGRMLLSETGRIATESWQVISEHFPQVALDAFVIMPNHIHGIISIADTSGSADSLDAVLDSFKSAATRRVSQLNETPGTPLWQSGYHERVLRNERAIAAMREYIAANPAAWSKDPLNPGGARFRPYCPLPAEAIS